MKGLFVLFVIEVGSRSVGIEDVVVRVELNGFGEMFDGFRVPVCFEGFVAFVFKLKCLLVAH